MASTTESSNLEKKIIDYFDNASYDELYSNDIWFTIIICIIVILIALYFYIKSTLVAYRNSWQDHKCNPILMPFASIINSDKVYDNNDLEYIVNNFNECLNILSEEVVEDAKKPIDSILSFIQNFFAILYTAFIGVKNFIEYLFTLISYFLTLIINSTQILLLQIRVFFMNINDFIRKILSIFTVLYYTIVLLIRSWKLVFGVLVLGWLLGFIVPISIMMIITLLLIIITYLMSKLPIIGVLLMWLFVPLLIFYGVAFIIFLVIFAIALYIYFQFIEFLQLIL